MFIFHDIYNVNYTMIMFLYFLLFMYDYYDCCCRNIWLKLFC